MNQTHNRIMPESEGNLLAVEIGERITLEEYREIFEQAADTLLVQYKESRLLLNYTKNFLGWDMDAAEMDLKILFLKGRLISKIALVNPPEKVLVRWQTMKTLVGGEVRFFIDLQEALLWARS